MTKLGMGVVGVGTMGKRHAENIRRLIPEAQLIAVADADLRGVKIHCAALATWSEILPRPQRGRP